MRNRTHTECED